MNRKLPGALVLLRIGVLLFFAVPFHVTAENSFPVNNHYASIDFSAAARLAVSASKELYSESRRVQHQKGMWLWGLRSYLPRLSINVSEDDRLSEISSDSFTKNYSLNIDQLVWDGGRLSMSRKLEKIELDIAARNLDQAAREIADTAIGAYREVLFCRMVLGIREKALVYLEEQRRVLLRELELGLVLPIDVNAAGITVAEADIEIRSLKIDLAEAEQQFVELLGLEELPFLSEAIDIFRKPELPLPEQARYAAEARNPALMAARNMVSQKQIEAKYAALSWIPVFRITGSAGLSGQQYPLTKFNWSLGLTVEFSSPWVSGNFGGSLGREGPYDRNARVQTSAVPLPDPASAFSPRTAALNLSQEQLAYSNTFRLTGRMAEQAVEKCCLLDQKRLLTLEALELGKEQYRLAELKLELGKLTRLELMDAMMVLSEKEISAVRAAVALLEAERDLEQFLDFPPGYLAFFANQQGDR